MLCMMDHIVLNVEDESRMIEFYSNVVMLKTERLKEYQSYRVLPQYLCRAL